MIFFTIFTKGWDGRGGGDLLTPGAVSSDTIPLPSIRGEERKKNQEGCSKFGSTRASVDGGEASF